MTRLCGYERGIGIKQINLFNNLDLIDNITCIDGAIIMDQNCICCGIGMILYGKAIIPRNPARGARYNSAVNYADNQKRIEEKYLP